MHIALNIKGESRADRANRHCGNSKVTTQLALSFNWFLQTIGKEAKMKQNPSRSWE